MDASALVKRYVAELGSDVIRRAMQAADGWFICRVGYVETIRAVGLAAGRGASRAVDVEWPSFGVIDVDQDLVEHAARLALEHGLRSLDSLHLAAALLLPRGDLVFAAWDHRLHRAAQVNHLRVLPEAIA
ncbi:MAG: type II toxin-antitoxin system VapC family toxin [Trebonia sp.]